MKQSSKDDFLAKCREIDFSAESINFENNLAALKEKLSKIDEEKNNMMRKRFIKPSVMVAAALIATLSLSAVAFGEQAWRYLQTRVVEGVEFVHDFTVRESEFGEITGITIDWEALEEAGGGRIVVEVEGEERVMSDRLILYYDVNEAMNLLSIDAALPGYIPEGFVFQRAIFPICPINNPDEYGTQSIILEYSDGQYELKITIMYYPEEWGYFYWAGTIESFEINGYTARKDPLADEFFTVVLHKGDTVYLITSNIGGHDILIRIAESLK